MNKKNFIQKALAAVFVSGLVSCGQSPVLVDTEIENVGLKQQDGGAAIEFATFANRNTRAVATVSDLEFYHQTFKVFATKTSDEGSKVQTIFQGVEVKAQISETEEEANTWEYDTDRYWDTQADYYQFVAFAPAHAPLGYQHTIVEVNSEDACFFSPNDYTLIGQNLQQGAPATAEKNAGFTGETNADGDYVTDCDVMRSAPLKVTDPATTPVVSLDFSHTLAKLLVTVKANASEPYVITVTGVKVASLLSTGTYDHVEGWQTKGDEVVDYLYTSPAKEVSASLKTYFIESLVMPQDIAATHLLTLDYTITSGDYSEEFTYKATLADLFQGKATAFQGASSYSVNFNIAPEKNIITFETGVTEWVDTPSDFEIEKD